MNICLFRSCSVPIWISTPEFHVRNCTYTLHGKNIMERYVTTTYCLLELHICAWGRYVSTTYHLYTNYENNEIYMVEVFNLEFSVC